MMFHHTNFETNALNDRERDIKIYKIKMYPFGLRLVTLSHNLICFCIVISHF